jgi:anti-sigma factor RsiW
MNMKWLWNKCRRHEESISLLAADILVEEERIGVQAHLAECPACQAKFAELVALAGRFTGLGENLPQVVPSASLRRRWTAAVRESARGDQPRESSIVLAWFSGRRVAWGSLAAMWALVLFFRFAPPDAPRPASVAAAPASLREVLAALQVDRREGPFRADASNLAPKKQPPPTVPLPRCQRPGATMTTELEGA